MLTPPPTFGAKNRRNEGCGCVRGKPLVSSVNYHKGHTWKDVEAETNCCRRWCHQMIRRRSVRMPPSHTVCTLLLKIPLNLTRHSWRHFERLSKSGYTYPITMYRMLETLDNRSVVPLRNASQYCTCSLRAWKSISWVISIVAEGQREFADLMPTIRATRSHRRSPLPTRSAQAQQEATHLSVKSLRLRPTALDRSRSCSQLAISRM